MKKAEYITSLILFCTMLLIFWQANTARDEYKAKNKPVVGIDSPSALFILPDDDINIGKTIVWDERKKIFTCLGKGCDGIECKIQSLVIKVPVKNFGIEPAIDIKQENEIIIGGKVIKNSKSNFAGNSIMPNQSIVNNVIISKEDVYNAYFNKEKISIKYKFEYSDLTRKVGLFEYCSELVIIDNNQLSLITVNSDFKDNR